MTDMLAFCIVELISMVNSLIVNLTLQKFCGDQICGNGSSFNFGFDKLNLDKSELNKLFFVIFVIFYLASLLNFAFNKLTFDKTLIY
jgi:hypothetical protein